MNNLYLRITQFVRDHKGLDWLVLGIGLVSFGLLTARTITASSIWFDEAFSAYIIKFNFIEIARYTANDVHPPLYYWILKPWIELFGTSEVAFRSMSILFGMTTIILGFLLAKRLFGRRAAWVSLLFLAISPMLVRYSQEARMYTLVTTIVLAATYVLTFAVNSKKRTPWVLYGVLVSLGMWTHYFTAIVWMSHWVWRFVVTRQSGAKGKQLVTAFFTKNWVMAYAIAIGLFLPWLPSMYRQLTDIQTSGFWIEPVGVNTFTNYMTNILFYAEHDQFSGWLASAMFGLVVVVVITLGLFTRKLYESMTKKQRQDYLLIIVVTFVPMLILFLVSLPPMKSSFVERYLMPSITSFALFAGITLTLTKVKIIWRALVTFLIIVCMIFGIANVYRFGNFNKNSNTQINTRQVIEQIKSKAQPGEPIIASSPWVFYEAVFYSTDEHSIYFIDANVEYIYGSLDMLKYNDQHKIKDLDEFAQRHPIIWYMGNSGNEQLVSPSGSWKELQKFSINSELDKTASYKAVQYQAR